MNLIQLENVRKQFGNFTAVDDISFSIEKGCIYGLLGPNGAGKTTTLRMIMDIIAPDSGKITFSENRQIKHFLDRIGYLPEERGLYRKMKVQDVILFIAELKGMRKSEAIIEIEKWIVQMQLNEWVDKRVDQLSKGMAQKIQFITTVLHSPELIILDEPFSGLDPINMTLLKDMMLDLRENGATIIFSTHVMEQVEKLCDRICLIHQGSILLEGELRTIKQSFGKSSVEIEYIGSIEPIRDSQWVQDCNDFGQYAEIKLKTPEDYRPFLRELVDKKVDVTRFELMEPTLHDIFVRSVEAHGGTVPDAE
ncbi:ATP-binding cassette domain-containing protein [Candidatus Poribacteria bacterium]|nr:ATP-binding cassette domain-containing protein [Candidatus Poribacteria bacterium]